MCACQYSKNPPDSQCPQASHLDGLKMPSFPLYDWNNTNSSLLTRGKENDYPGRHLEKAKDASVNHRNEKRGMFGGKTLKTNDYDHTGKNNKWWCVVRLLCQAVRRSEAPAFLPASSQHLAQASCTGSAQRRMLGSLTAWHPE